MYIFSQIGLFIFTAIGAYLISRKDKWKRYGYIVGLFGEPFWIYASLTSHQYGVFALALWYSFCWIQGIYNYWIKKEE